MDYSCRFPWTWLNVDLNRDRWRFCCKTTWQQNFNSEYSTDHWLVTSSKEQFLQRQKPNACAVCWREEELEGASFRTQKGGAVSHERLRNFQGLEWIDIMHGDTCNLFCASCGPESSTKWQGILSKEGKPYNKSIKLIEDHKLEMWKKLTNIINDNLSTLQSLNLWGGEPSIDPNFLTLIDNLCTFKAQRTEPIALKIYTNGFWPREENGNRFMEKLDAARASNWDINLRFSIDAIGIESEYIRGGSRWATVEKNLEECIAKGYCKEINITTSLLNLPIQHDILGYFLSKPYADIVKPIHNMVNYPNFFSVANLGKEISRWLPDWNKYPDHKNWHDYKNWLKNLAVLQSNGIPDTRMIKRFREYTKEYSRMTGIEIPQRLDNFYQSYVDYFKSYE